LLTARGSVLVVGTVGTTLVAASSWWVGGVPAWFRNDQPSALQFLPLHAGLAWTAYFVGLTMLLGAWLVLGRLVLTSDDQLDVRPTVVAWALPMLASMPMGRDLWVYLAHGRLVDAGFDPYRDSPAVLDAAYRSEVSTRWLHTPSPYGPFWIEIARVAGVLTDPHVVVGTFVLRLPVFGAFVATAWLLYRLSAQFGVRADRAVWLALANPLAVMLTVGGHNDLILAAFVVAGIAVAASGNGSWPRLVAGGALIGLAALVKFPALIALGFAVPIWLAVRDRGRSMRMVLAAVAVSVGGGIVSAGIVTAAAGLGAGWARQASADNSILNWQSLPTFAGMIVNSVRLGASHAGDLNDTVRLFRSLGSAVAAAVVLALWLMALRRNRVSDTAALLGAAFVAVVILGQTFQPWYLCWALPFLGLGVAGRRWLGVIVAGSVFEMLVTLPDGRGLEDRVIAIPAALLAAVVAWWTVRSAAADRDADDARPSVRADRRADLRGDQLSR
jgi:Glycosyltransferase family 87